MLKTPRAGTPSAARKLVRAFADALGKDPQAEAAYAFIAQAAADAAPDELPELSSAEIAANLLDFWRFAAHRRGRGATMRVAPVIGAWRREWGRHRGRTAAPPPTMDRPSGKPRHVLRLHRFVPPT